MWETEGICNPKDVWGWIFLMYFLYRTVFERVYEKVLKNCKNDMIMVQFFGNNFVNVVHLYDCLWQKDMKNNSKKDQKGDE